MYEKQAIISQSRFPSEIKKDQLFIGNLTNVLNIDYVQLKMFKVKTIFHLSPERFPGLEKEFECVHFPVKLFNKDLEYQNFKEIVD